MNDLTIFENPEFGRLRSLKISGEPWFVGKDVAAALGYVDTAQAIRKHVDDEDKGVVEATTPGGKQRITTINESGLYSLMLKSKLPGAKKFKRWVTSEVLPSIRRAGAYAMPAAAPADDAMFEKLWAELERKQKFNSYVGQFCNFFWLEPPLLPVRDVQPDEAGRLQRRCTDLADAGRHPRLCNVHRAGSHHGRAGF